MIIKKTYMRHLLFVILISTFISCSQQKTPQSEYIMVWNDEFEQNEPELDSSKWFLETIGPNNGSWYNDELQHYTSRTENAVVNDGFLTITAKKEVYTHSEITLPYTSARLNSKFSFTYGKVTVRAKLPKAQGTWPAIWTLGSNYEVVGWPACGEIDIMEQLFEDFDMIQCAVHTPDTHGENTIVKQVNVSDVTENFHEYGMEWTSDKIDFSVDGKVYFTYSPKNKTSQNWPYYNDQYILLNVAMGGNLGGTIDPNFNEDTMVVDYVRVYQKK